VHLIALLQVASCADLTTRVHVRLTADPSEWTPLGVTCFW